jgi:hypothetical protein
MALFLSKRMSFDLSLLGPNKRDFYVNLRSSPSKISRPQSTDYFTVLLRLIRSNESEITLAVVRALISYLKLNPSNLTAFKSGRFIQKLQLNSESLDFLHWAAIEAPDLVIDAINSLSLAAPNYPSQVLVIIALYSKGIVSGGADPGPIVELLYSQSETFSQRETAENFAAVVAYIVGSDGLGRDRLQKLWDAILPIFQIKNTAPVSAAYYALAVIAEKAKTVANFPTDMVVRHFKREPLPKAIVSLLLRVQNLPVSPALVDQLLMGAEQHRRCAFVLMKLAEKQEWAQILTQDLEWLSRNLPTFQDTLRIAVVVMYDPERRREVAASEEVTTFLTNVAAEKNGFITLGVVLQRLAFDRALIGKLSTGGLWTRYFRGTLRGQQDDLIEGGLFFAKKIAAVGYVPDLDEAAAAIVELVKARRAISKALGAGVKLCAYPQCVQKFQTLQFDSVLGRLQNDPKLRELREIVASFRSRIISDE